MVKRCRKNVLKKDVPGKLRYEEIRKLYTNWKEIIRGTKSIVTDEILQQHGKREKEVTSRGRGEASVFGIPLLYIRVFYFHFLVKITRLKNCLFILEACNLSISYSRLSQYSSHKNYHEFIS